MWTEDDSSEEDEDESEEEVSEEEGSEEEREEEKEEGCPVLESGSDCEEELNNESVVKKDVSASKDKEDEGDEGSDSDDEINNKSYLPYRDKESTKKSAHQFTVYQKTNVSLR